MNKLKTAALAFAISAAAGQASAVLVFTNDWGFNPAGTGLAGAIMPIDEMTYLGLSYTESADNNTNGVIDAGDTFDDVGRLAATGFANDGSPLLGTGLNSTYQISGAFLDWTGSYSNPVGPNTGFVFDAGGTLNLFLDTVTGCGSFATCTDGTNILSLSINTGSGNINFGNTAGVDGNIDILFDVVSAAPGYWFLDTDDDGVADTDLATYSGPGAAIALTDSNNSITTPTAAVAADFVASTGFGTPTGVGDIYTSNDGSATIGAEVPEPGILGLLGLGLAGLAGFSLRRKS